MKDFPLCMFSYCPPCTNTKHQLPGCDLFFYQLYHALEHKDLEDWFIIRCMHLPGYIQQELVSRSGECDFIQEGTQERLKNILVGFSQRKWISWRIHTMIITWKRRILLGRQPTKLGKVISYTLSQLRSTCSSK